MKKTALITGASSGIGLATARVLASNNYRLIICGRNKDRLSELAKELKEKTDIHLLIFDVRDKVSVFNAIENLPTDYSQIDVLINNAGNAHGLSPIQDGSLDDWDAMIDGNVKGLLYVTKAVLSGMITRDAGHIINISSIAGRDVYPNGNVYSASKSAVDAINSGMRIDLLTTQIKVSSVSPGLVETGFSEVRFKGDNNRAKKVYEDYTALKAEDIADLILYILSAPKHVNIADTLILPSAQATSSMVDKSGKK
jgi:NADP-dependent 3-hydroxy acid dehydrogenase YdfG